MSEHKAKPTEEEGMVNTIPFPNRPIEAKYERVLGQLTIRFSWLHAFLEAFSWKVWKLERPTGSILTKDLPIKRLVEKLRESAPYTIAKGVDRKDFIAILNSVEKAAERRNDLLHSLWFFEDEKTVSCMSRKGSKRAGEGAPSLDEIKQLNRSISNIASEIEEFEKRDSLKSPALLALEYLAREQRDK